MHSVHSDHLRLSFSTCSEKEESPSLSPTKSSDESKSNKIDIMKSKLKNTISTINLKTQHSPCTLRKDSTGMETYMLPYGTSIDNLYTFHEILGEGSTSVVKRANHVHTNAEVAIKIFRTNDAELVIAIRREYELQSSFDHFNIVKAIELQYDNPNGKAYLVLEYVKGTTLSQLIQSGTLNESNALSLFWQIMGALLWMHKKGIMHRDLQPTNILVTPDGLAKIADFSIATKITDKLYMREGTYEFMSPEVISGQGYGEKADLWSMGILLYMMVMGNYPFSRARYSSKQPRIINQRNPSRSVQH